MARGARPESVYGLRSPPEFESPTLRKLRSTSQNVDMEGTRLDRSTVRSGVVRCELHSGFESLAFRAWMRNPIGRRNPA